MRLQALHSCMEELCEIATIREFKVLMELQSNDYKIDTLRINELKILNELLDRYFDMLA